MRDELVRVHLKEPDLLVVGLLCSQTARRASEIHACLPTSAGLLAEGIASAFGIAGLLAGEARINLQVTCDGPATGLFVDADATGKGRGYVKNPFVNFLAGGARFDASGALGRSGSLSVLRELKAGEFYRGTVALEHFDLARDLERYFRESDQIQTAVELEVHAGGAEQLGRVSGVFVQAMPNARPDAVEKARDVLDLVIEAPIERAFDLVRPLAEKLGGEIDVLAEYPLEYQCGCSLERVVRAVLAMGRGEIEDLLKKEGRAVATCAFCNSVYEVDGDQLLLVLAAFDKPKGTPEQN